MDICFFWNFRPQHTLNGEITPENTFVFAIIVSEYDRISQNRAWLAKLAVWRARFFRESGGYGYTTATNLAGINRRRFAVMCPLSEQYREIAAKELAKIVALGPSGMLFDEVCHHGPAKYCFATNHGHPVPGYIYAGDVPLAKALQKAAGQNPDFLFAGKPPRTSCYSTTLSRSFAFLARRSPSAVALIRARR